MNIFKRILRIGQAEIHAAVEKMEDPIKMTEQGLRELRDDVAEATESYARVKAMAIRTENEQNACTREAGSYGEKAVLIMQKAQGGELDIIKAEQLAREALSLRRKYAADAEMLSLQAAAHQQSAAEVLKNIEVLKDNLAKWEKELKTLKTRVTVSKATEQVNKQLAHIDSNSTIAMLERMKEKVDDKEALSKAYGEIAQTKHELKDELNKLLNDDPLSIEKDLEAIKRELGINPKS
jgi:phage shock protein A